MTDPEGNSKHRSDGGVSPPDEIDDAVRKDPEIRKGLDRIDKLRLAMLGDDIVGAAREAYKRVEEILESL